MNTSLEVAQYFLDQRESKSDSTIPEYTNMKLQKLVYFAHGYNLAILDKPLIDSDFFAFQYGPIEMDLYAIASSYGRKEVKKIKEPNDYSFTDEENELLKKVDATFSKYTASQLSEITHRKGSPWSEVWELSPFGKIPAELIREYFVSVQNA